MSFPDKGLEQNEADRRNLLSPLDRALQRQREALRRDSNGRVTMPIEGSSPSVNAKDSVPTMPDARRPDSAAAENAQFGTTSDRPHAPRLDDALSRTGRPPRENRYAKSLGLDPSARRRSPEEEAESALTRGESGRFMLPRDRTVRPEELTGGSANSTKQARVSAPSDSARPTQLKVETKSSVAGTAGASSQAAELAEVAEAWPHLTNTAKATIMTVVKAGRRRV